MSNEQQPTPLLAETSSWIKDILIRHDDDGNEISREEIVQGPNLFVLNASVLVAALFKDEPSYSGITHWAVGTGTTTPIITLAALVTELTRVATTVVFLDGAGVPTATPTKTIQITTTIPLGTVGSLTEMGLFGGNNGNLMVDYKTHSAISMDGNTSLVRKIIINI